MDKLVMEIENCLSINNAKIEINKINVIGGVNGSGKSTASILLYSFLKANSIKRRYLAKKWIIDDINKIIDKLNFKEDEYGLLNHIEIEDDYSDIKNKFEKVIEISKKYDKFSMKKYLELTKELNYNINKLFKKLENTEFDLVNLFIEKINGNVNHEMMRAILKKEISFEEYDEFSEAMNNYFDSLSNDIFGTTNFEGDMEPCNNFNENYNKVKRINVINLFRKGYLDFLLRQKIPYDFPKDCSVIDVSITDFSIFDIDLNDELYEYIRDYIIIKKIFVKMDMNNFTSVYDTCLSIKDSLNTLLGEDNVYLSRNLFKELVYKKELRDSEGKIRFYVNSINSYNDAFEYFFKNDFIDSFCYVDNISIFDFGLFYEVAEYSVSHLKKLYNELTIMEFEKMEYFEKEFGKEYQEFLNIGKIIKKIKNIIDLYDVDDYSFFHLIEFYKDLTGFEFERTEFYENEVGNKFEPNEDAKEIVGKIRNIIDKRYRIGDVYLNNDSSGTKQMGIIQLLLYLNKLRKNGYLIIDEPEVNLHPDWQFKFAEMLVLLTKELNITIYLNSHSPMFIESIAAFTEFYDMEEDVNYYLTEEVGEGKYNFTRIPSTKLYKIYNNLGNVYDLIDELRLEKHLEE